ncbi:hypothetical protein JW865_01270 [Candidatus Bathyarchaeota archaeon]|nr:hypothetical protein [Candidatus Bathyarchaeota archaeon]
MDDSFNPNPKISLPIIYGNHRPVIAEIIAVLNATFTDRKTKLIDSYSRAVKKYDIHELMITDQEPYPGKEFSRMNAIAFFEVKNGGLIVSGDKVLHNNELFGILAGYDLNHMPNHMNIVIRKGSLTSETMNVGDTLIFTNS